MVGLADDIQLTDLIHRMQRGDRGAGDSVFMAAAARLRAMAQSLMSSERTNGFYPSDLVQETYAQKVAGLRLHSKVASREHFFSLMAGAMRQVLTDRGRARNAAKRQAPRLRTFAGSLPGNTRLLDLAAALCKLEKLDSDGREIVRMKYEMGMTWDEMSARTGRSVWQVRAECEYVVEWLRGELR
jgi:RNA polymerase sigma factor (TIGR02999 family)